MWRMFNKIHHPDKEKALLNFFKKNKTDAVFVEYGFTGAAVMNVANKLAFH